MKIYVWENDAMMSRSIHHLSVHPPNHPSVHPPIIHLTHEEGYMLDESPAHRRTNMDTETTELAMQVLGEETRVPGEKVQTPDKAPWPAGN